MKQCAKSQSIRDQGGGTIPIFIHGLSLLWFNIIDHCTVCVVILVLRAGRGDGRRGEGGSNIFQKQG